MSLPAAYSKAVASIHWLSGPAMIASIGCVLTAQNAPKGEKGDWMWRHKSMGLLSGFLLGPRVVARLLSKGPGMLPGSSKVEHYLAQASHASLYGFMTVMPVTGIAMGYFGGKGLPFFFTTIPGAEKADGGIAKKAFWWHKNVGYYGKFVVPLHIGASVTHLARGHPILARLNPFGK